MTEPVLEGDGSLADRMLAALTTQGFTTGTLADRERARLTAKLVLSAPQAAERTLTDLYVEAVEPQRIWGE